MKTLVTAIILCVIVLPGPGLAQSNDEILAEANALFHQASDESNEDQALALYRQALLRYEQVYRRQPQARLAYNIGNTYYRLGDLGRALLNYRRAEAGMAYDAKLQHNLGLVRAQRQDQLGEPGPQNMLDRLNLHRSLSLELRTRILLGLYAAFWLTAALFLLKKFPMPRWLPAVLLFATLVLSTSVGLDRLKPPARQGVIVADEIIGRQGDGRNFQPAFATPLHSATEFTVVDRRGYWLQIELSDGRRCWIPARSAELI